jgi:translation initiation factor 2 beta subunit (eIF-2beta)/eIF-5
MEFTTEQIEELKNNPLCIFHNGNPKSILNSRLIQQQGLTEDDVDELKKLHIEKLIVLDLINSTDNKIALKNYVHVIELIEFALQKVWKFEQNRNYHDWFDVPKCMCPKLDNYDNKGIDIRIITLECPLHGNK